MVYHGGGSTLQQRETATDRLADVIQVIQLGRRTGTLTVERGQGPTFEEGMITFANGQVTQASVGSRRGQEALRVLHTWRNCLFAFITPSANSFAPLQAPASHPNPQQNGRGNGRFAPPAPRGDVPHRTKPIEEVLQVMDMMGFSRVHRRLLLLIDGQRSVPELIRLVGRDSEEVLQQLSELERAGFIHQ